ncbi:MvdC/MvdD family ATP grasp protein [Pseudomonas aeruginosa]
MLLLVTNRRDITTDYVVAEIQRRRLPYFRLNTELLPQALCMMDSYPANAWSISLAGKTIRGDQVQAAYFRRPGAPESIQPPLDEGERAYVEAEWNSFIKSLYTRLDGTWLNSPTDIFLAEDKPRQLMLAHELGFNVPFARITNDIAATREVTEAGPAIGKPLRQALLTGERERLIFTTRLEQIRDGDAAAIAMAPLIVQAEVIKKYDVRVTVVGTKVFATSIWSQEHEETQVDWRQGSRPDLKHERIELPRPIQQQCLELLRRLNLRYGAIDFICDQQGKLWFLEINPNGQWAWIENLTGYPIAGAIVDELEDIARAQTPT